jgi:transcription termination factor Rho
VATTLGDGPTVDRFDGRLAGAQGAQPVGSPEGDRLDQTAAPSDVDAGAADANADEIADRRSDQARAGDVVERADSDDDSDEQDQGNNRQGRGESVGEPGNRRRRRRGRDRDRDRPEEAPTAEPVEVEGILDLRDEGYGFLRTRGFLPSKDDVYVSAKQVRQMGLRKGDTITGLGRPAARSEKNPAMLRIDLVNGEAPDEARKRPKFEDLTPLFPDQKLRLELPDDPTNMTNRIIDLISPIGKGQRGLIVSPPKAGKTMIIKSIAQAIERNNPEVQLIVLLVDERPEEVTDMRRSIQGEVVASTFDRPSDEHTQVAELTIERAKRLVEEGTDVVIILDGITRLARAYNLAAPATGRIMSGGVDSGALYPPKRFFGAARNIEEGGSLTILATALIDTGSKMDEVIFEEFKGTGNMELRLDRRLAERRIYPAIDVDASSTRHEELLFERKQLQQVWKLRRVLSGLSGGDGEGRPGAGLELLLDRLKTFRSNDDFLGEIAKAPSM